MVSMNFDPEQEPTHPSDLGFDRVIRLWLKHTLVEIELTPEQWQALRQRVLEAVQLMEESTPST